MIYKFRIVSDEVDNFKREICIDSDASFLELHDAILDSVGFSKDQMTSFFICDDDWEKKTEITLMDMGKDSDEDTWIMASTKISDLIEDEGQRLVFVFDYMTDRMIFKVMKEIEKGKPVYLICQSGLRSYIASRILEGNGYETYNFSGGFRFYDAVVNDRALIERAHACGMDY